MNMRLHRPIALFFVLSLGSFAQLASHDQVLQPPISLRAGLYPANHDPRKDIREGVSKAAREHKNVILDFGADWCLDCHVLENAFQNNAEIRPLVEKHFVVVHIDIGKDDPPKTNALAQKYGIDTEKGIPALAVLSGSGKLLYSQGNHEFSSARRLRVQTVIDFLEKWKPKKL